MNKAILNFWSLYDQHKSDVNDFGTFLLTILIGNFIKIYREPDNPNKWRISRFLAEFLISSLIAFTFYTANSLWLHLPYLFTLIICVWLGSLSSKIYEEMDTMLSWLFESIKTYFNKKFLSSLAILLSIGLLTGCKSSQPVATNSIENIKKEFIQSNKEKETIKNQAINDSLKKPIPNITTSKPDCDSIANAKFKEYLKGLNFKKTSGNNSFGIYFDELKNELVAYANIAETQNQKITDLETKILEEKQKNQQVKPVKYIPEHIQKLAAIGVLALLYLLYRILKPFILWVGKLKLPFL